MKELTVKDLSRSVREAIFHSNLEQLFFACNAERYQIASCLDTIDDAQFAIDEYLLLPYSATWAEKGKIYLAVYGVFQAMYLQQDALRYLADAVGYPFELEKYAGLSEVRRIRNQIFGHPTKFGRGKKTSFYAISRHSLTLVKFKVLGYDLEDRREMRTVDIKLTISKNEKFVRQALIDLNRKLAKSIREHKAKFRNEPLSRMFSELPSRLFENVKAGIMKSAGIDQDKAISSINIINELLNALSRALIDRRTSPEEYPGVDRLWPELLNHTKTIRAFFADNDSEIQTLTPEMASIYTRRLEKRLYELRKICYEIDEFYNSEDAT